MEMKKNSKYINYTKEDNEKCLEKVSLPMRELLSSLEDNPKIVFVELNFTGKKPSVNGSAYKTRNKSIKVLSSSEVEEKAIQDVKLMYKEVQKMISSSIKLSTSEIIPNKTINLKNSLINCKKCQAIFSRKSDLVVHTANSHPEISLQNCTFCDKKFFAPRGLAQHITKCHGMNKKEIESKNSKEMSTSPFKTHLDGKEIKNDDCTYSAYLTDLNTGLPVVNISQVEVNADSNESSLKVNASLYSPTNSSNSTDSFQRDRNIDCDSLSLNGRQKFDVPEVSSMHMKSQHSVSEEEDSKFRVNVVLPLDHEEAPFKIESDFVFLPNNNLELKPKRQKRVSFNKYEEQEMIPSSSQNGLSSLKICCSCLGIMHVMKKIFIKQEYSKFKCNKCPFCGVYCADNYFELHVAKAHIICTEEECSSQVILTDSQSRKLFMQIKIECIHLNCNHNSHKNKSKHQECDTTNKIESDQVNVFSIKAESSMKQENSSQNSDSLLLDIGSSNTEENRVSSSNGCIYEASENVFDESETKVKSSKPSLCCYVCKEIFHQEQKLLSHLFNFHRFTHPFTCHICFLCYKFIKELEVHMQTHEREILEKKSSLNVIENGLKYEKKELSDESTQHPQYLEYNEQNLQYFESEVQDLQYLESEAHGLQCLQSEVEDFQLESEVQDLHLESEVQDLQLESNLRQDFYVPEELNFLEFNAKDSFEESTKCISDVSTIDSNHAKVKVLSDDATFQTQEKDSPKKKPKISCVVEKVEYPLDIHNLYAYIRKTEEITSEVNTAEVGIQNPSTKSKDLFSLEANSDSNTSPKKTEFKRMATFFSTPAKKMKMDDFPGDSSETFDCKLCAKIFDSKRSYSEHMFFMHDAIFDDSVVSDLLKPISRAKKSKIIGKTENLCIDNSTNSSHEALSMDFHKEECHPSPEKMERNSIVEDTETRNCSQCGERYLQVTSYFQHRYDVHGDDSLVHICDNCSKVLITVNMVNSHLCTLVNTFSCNDCELRFTNGLGLKEHNMLTHFETIGPHICDDCKKCFLTKRMLEKHKRRIHSGNCIIYLKEEISEELNLSVKVTDYKIESTVNESIESTVNQSIENTVDENIENIKEDTEKLLQRVVSPVKSISKKGKIDSLTCPICKIGFQTTKELEAHLIIVHGKTTNYCLLCNRLFAFGRGVRHILDFHITPADKSKEYEFSWGGDPRQDVKEAIEVLGQKRLEAICSYDDYTTLTDSLSFQCRLCMMTYSAIRYYRNHYIQRHDKFCALCGQSFESNKVFTAHVEAFHNSLKHYIWFTETIISTIIQTERSKDSSETFTQIIKRKLDENEVNTASQLLEQMENERIASNSIFSCQLTEETGESPVGTGELPVSISEPSTESYREDMLEWPEFSMELEVTDNGTVDTQNPNYCSNEIFVKNDEKKECTERNNDSMKANDLAMCERSFDMSNYIFENAISLDDKSVVHLKENEMLTAIASCSADNHMSLDQFAKDISLEKGEDCNSVADCNSVGINSDIQNKKITLTVLEEDLHKNKDNIREFAKHLSTTCSELSVDEIFETLQEHVISLS